VTRGRNRELAGVAVALAAAGAVAGAAAGGIAVRRRRSVTVVPAEDAPAIARRVLEEPWAGNLDAIDELVATAYLGYDQAEPSPTQGPSGMRENVERYLAAFHDGSLTVDDQVVDGDRVATKWTVTGTHTGEFAGIAPTGKQVTVSGVTISRIAAGKVVEAWTTWDRLGLLVQLGAVGEPARA
jgi:predicted ester cyclase